jgi:S-adenosylmethionine hydrolase
MVLTLLTDFGEEDGYVGVMKGVIWGIAPQVQIADLSHTIQPQNVRQAALVLERAVGYFPKGTVHVAVVDPGVGTSRRAIAARLGNQYYVGPDNGLFTPIIEQVENRGEPVKIVDLDKPEYWLPSVSQTFHGRDIFAPVSGHLAAGVALEDLGSEIDDPIRITLPRPERNGDHWRAQIAYQDHFGNLSTLLAEKDLIGSKPVKVRVKGVEIEGISRAFGERDQGELVAIFNNAGYLEIARVNGSAAEYLGAQVGDWIEVVPETKP